MKEIIKCRIRVAETFKNDNRNHRVTLSEMVTYGQRVNNRTIVVDGYTFHAGRKNGFGKSAYVYENINGIHCKVTIDRIETYATVA